MSLLELSEYKNYLNLAPGTTKLTALTALQNEVEAKVVDRLKRDLVTQTYVEYLNGNGRKFITPKQYPITAITKIEVFDGLDSNNVDVWETWTKGDEYQRVLIEDEVSITLDGAIFPKGTQNIRLTYVAGYSSIPNGIKKACKELFKLYYDRTNYGANNLGVRSKSTTTSGSVTDSVVYDIDAEERILKQLDAYARIDI
jgi:hypothetical protein